MKPIQYDFNCKMDIGVSATMTSPYNVDADKILVIEYLSCITNELPGNSALVCAINTELNGKWVQHQLPTIFIPEFKSPPFISTGQMVRLYSDSKVHGHALRSDSSVTATVFFSFSGYLVDATPSPPINLRIE